MHFGSALTCLLAALSLGNSASNNLIAAWKKQTHGFSL
jgi:hypothetical protein